MIDYIKVSFHYGSLMCVCIKEKLDLYVFRQKNVRDIVVFKNPLAKVQKV